MRSRSSNHAKSDSHNARSQGKGKRKPPKVCLEFVPLNIL
jgi:hypothetical protein